MAQWVSWNVRTYKDMNAIVSYAIAASATQPSVIDVQEMRMLSCHIYEIPIKNEVFCRRLRKSWYLSRPLAAVDEKLHLMHISRDVSMRLPGL